MTLFNGLIVAGEVAFCICLAPLLVIGMLGLGMLVCLLLWGRWP